MSHESSRNLWRMLTNYSNIQDEFRQSRDDIFWHTFQTHTHTHKYFRVVCARIDGSLLFHKESFFFLTSCSYCEGGHWGRDIISSWCIIAHFPFRIKTKKKKKWKKLKKKKQRINTKHENFHWNSPSFDGNYRTHNITCDLIGFPYVIMSIVLCMP